MNEKLALLIKANDFSRDEDGIYLSSIPASEAQEAERAVREKVAKQKYDDYLGVISKHHSIPVMDCEVERFLSGIPEGGVILDVGGCWGWHWRRLAELRPDVSVLIIDFIRANLLHAQRVLGGLIGSQVELMHADATALPFSDGDNKSVGFDGVWTVQVFQHIPDFHLACSEAHRVLVPGGHFVNYSLHLTPLNKVIYQLLRKKFHAEGMVKELFYLSRANDKQREIIKDIFVGEVADRYTECLFHPDLRFTVSGSPGSLLGKMDVKLSNSSRLGKWCARQRSFEVVKP